MTDGPHKSLPMKRPWKKVGERARLPAFDPDEVAAKISDALASEANSQVFRQIGRLFAPSDQGALEGVTADTLGDAIESVRMSAPAEPLTNALCDAAEEQVALVNFGEAGFKAAAENAFKDTTQTCFDGIEDHWLRTYESAKATEVRRRLNEGAEKVDYSLLIERVTSASPRTGATVKKQGLEEGPSL